jgi:hypothetical protein
MLNTRLVSTVPSSVCSTTKSNFVAPLETTRWKLQPPSSSAVTVPGTICVPQALRMRIEAFGVAVPVNVFSTPADTADVPTVAPRRADAAWMLNRRLVSTVPSSVCSTTKSNFVAPLETTPRR